MAFPTPPKFSAENYEKWRKEMFHWDVATSVPDEKKAAVVFLSLEDAVSREAVLELDPKELNVAGGLSKLLEKLDATFELQPIPALTKFYEELHEVGNSRFEPSRNDDDRFPIFVKYLDGRTHTLKTERDEPILHLMFKIFEETGFDPFDQILIYDKTRLERNRTAGFYNITKEATLECFLRMGGPPLFGSQWPLSPEVYERMNRKCGKLRDDQANYLEKMKQKYNCRRYSCVCKCKKNCSCIA